jgi:putative ABC transport system permease protein
MNGVAQDLRHALRALGRAPGFAAVAVLTLALGIGANTAIFSVVDAVLLRPLPFPEPERLVMVRETSPRTGASGIHLSPANFELLRAESAAFSALGAYSMASANLAGGGEPERLQAVQVSAGLLAALGVAPARGRLFAEDEDRAGRTQVAVLSDALWRRRFAADPGIVGRSLMLDGRAHTVVGVMPAGFRFPVQGEAMDLWLPLRPEVLAEHPRARFLRVVGRLRPGVGEDQAAAEMSVQAARLQRHDPTNNDRLGLMLLPLRERVVGDVRGPLVVLFGAVVAVLLVACANVAALLLARGARRQRELAVRTALGASRRRLVRQLLTEGLVLALLGGLLAAVTASWTLRLLVRWAPQDLPRAAEVGLDARVLLFTLLASLAAGLAAALLPALQVSRSAPLTTLKDAAAATTPPPARRRLRSALVTAEVALTLSLAVTAGLFARSFAALRGVDPGFRPEGVLTAQLVLSPSRYATAEGIFAVYADLVGRVSALPGVAAAGASTHFPFQNRWRNPIAVEGRPAATPADLPLATISPVTPGYFAAMGVSLRSGRVFSERDREDALAVAVVDEVLARQVFGGEDPLGRRIKLGAADGPSPWLEVVGVVRAVRESPLAPAVPELYLPLRQIPAGIAPFVATGLTLAVRTAGDPAPLAPALRTAVRAVDPDQPVFNVATLDELLSGSRADRRFQLALLGLFAAFALFLASLGLYGVVSQHAGERTRELGLRLALGARRGDVLRLVLRQGLGPVAVGIALGLAASAAVSRLLAGLLFGVGPADPLTFAGMALLLAGVALLAAYLPARQAMRLDPLAALRHE